MSNIDTLLDRNTRFAAKFSSASLPVAPAMKVAIVTCMDARLDLGSLLGLEEGDAHIIRNAGGIVTDDVIRSITISQHVLGTREIMLIHHSDCGMLTFTDSEMNQTLLDETGVQPSFEIGSFSNLDRNVLESVARIHASQFVAHKDVVRGFVYELETGQLREVH